MTARMIDTADDISREWMAGVLTDAGIDAILAGIAVEPVGTGQMGSCLRVALTYSAGSGPASVIVKLPAPDVADRATSAIGYRCEVGFYGDVAEGLNVRVPECHLAVVSEAGTEFTLVLEDLAPAQQGDQIAGCTPDQARAAAVNVAGLHAPTWGDDSIRDLDWTIPFPTEGDGAAFVAAVVADGTDKFLDRFSVDGSTAGVLRRFAGETEAWLAGRPEPFSLVHGDYRLDNLLFASPDSPDSPDSSGPAGAIDLVTAVDWQVVSVGLPLRDVAFLVAAGFDPTTRRLVERDVVSAYHAALVDLGVAGYDADRCWDDYRYALLYPVMITVLGALVSKPSERGDLMFTTMAERSAVAVIDHDTFAMIPEP